MTIEETKKLLKVGDKLLCTNLNKNGIFKNLTCTVVYFATKFNYFCLEFEENMGGHSGESYYTNNGRVGHFWCITPGENGNDYDFEFKKIN